jgi:DNA-binding NarL/FixJ family response regulator
LKQRAADDTFGVPIEVNLPVRVLVGDDSEVMRRTIAAYLSARPEVEVVGEADNFEETARLVGELKPDVVVVDLRMSTRLDGEARSIKDVCECRLIAISASVDDESNTMARRIGADAFIDKMKLYDQLLPKILELAG